MAGKTGNLTIKELSARVDKLSEQFHQGLQQIRADYVSKSTPSSTFQGNGDFFDKLKIFEDSINSSIDSLKIDVGHLNEEISSLKVKTNNMEIFKLHNSIVVHGIKEERTNLYDEIIRLCQSNLEITITKNDINHCYRIGKKSEKNVRPRLVAVQFCQRWRRDLVFANKKKLKGLPLMFTEMLTLDNLKLYRQARTVFKKAAWTFNGVVFVEVGENKLPIRCEADLQRVITNSEK